MPFVYLWSVGNLLSTNDYTNSDYDSHACSDPRTHSLRCYRNYREVGGLQKSVALPYPIQVGHCDIRHNYPKLEYIAFEESLATKLFGELPPLLIRALFVIW